MASAEETLFNLLISRVIVPRAQAQAQPPPQEQPQVPPPQAPVRPVGMSDATCAILSAQLAAKALATAGPQAALVPPPPRTVHDIIRDELHKELEAYVLHVCTDGEVGSTVTCCALFEPTTSAGEVHWPNLWATYFWRCVHGLFLLHVTRVLFVSVRTLSLVWFSLIFVAVFDLRTYPARYCHTTIKGRPVTVQRNRATTTCLTCVLWAYMALEGQVGEGQELPRVELLQLGAQICQWSARVVLDDSEYESDDELLSGDDERENIVLQADGEGI